MDKSNSGRIRAMKPKASKWAAINGTLTAIPRKHKMNAIRSRCNAGHNHPSKGEAARCDFLHLAQSGKVISNLKVNPTMQLVPGFSYKPDFSYTELTREITEDFKGMITQRFRDICRLWKYHGKGVLRITKQGNRGFIIAKEIQGVE